MIFRTSFAMTCLLAASYAHADTWTTLNGVQFEAEFRGMWGEAAIFQRADGRRAAITLLNMNAESRLRLQDLAKEVQEKRNQRVEELKKDAIAAKNAAAAEGPGGMFGGPKKPLPPAVPYSGITDGMDLETTVKHLNQQAASGHMRIYWDSLPARYQADLDKLRIELTGKVSPTQWDSRVAVISKIAKLLKEKEDMVFGVSMLAMLDDKMKADLRKSLVPVADQLAIFVSDDRISHASVSQRDLSNLIAGLSDDSSSLLRGLMESAPGGAASIPDNDLLEISQEGDDRGKVTNPATADTQSWIKVDGRWLPESVAGDWNHSLEKIKINFDSIFGDDSNAKVAQITSVLDQLLTATDQQAFDAVILSLLTQFGPAIPGLGGGTPPGF